MSDKSNTFKKFLGMQKLKKVALAHIATHLTQLEVGELGDTFRKMDRDNNGVIALRDVDDALRANQFSPELQGELRQLRKNLSLSGEDMLDWRNFLAAMMDKSVMMQEDKIRMAFDDLHKSEGNYLLVSDLVEIFGRESQAREIMGDVDTDGDGRISYEDFRIMMEGSFGE